MNKKWIYIKRVISVVLFFAIVASLYWFVDRTMKLKRTDGITTMQNYYVQPEGKVDVLMLGSSHMGMNFDTEVLWENYGISAYALWGSVQPFYNSYYFLKEAIDTSKPKVVVLDTYAATFQSEFSDDSRQITNIVGMRYNLNRLMAVMTSAPSERWGYLMLGLPCYHTRYGELSENDFSQYPWTPETVYDKGTAVRYGTGKCELADVSDITETKPLHEKQEEYLLKIIDLCKQENIELVLIKSPVAQRKSLQGYFNTVQNIADKNNIEFINYNLLDEEVGITAEDFWTDGNHLNTNGCRKVSDHLAKYLKEQYKLTDHRGDSAYDSWAYNATDLQNRYLRVVTKHEDYLNELKRNDRSIAVVKYDAEDKESNLFELSDSMAESFGFFPNALADEANGVWLSDSTHSDKFNKYEKELSNLQMTWNKHTVRFNTEGSLKVSVDSEDVCEITEDCIIVIVYDNDSGEIEDTVAFTVSGEADSSEIKLKHYN